MSTILEYKCPCCDGALSFDSSLQKMKCPFCDTEFEMETLKSFDEALNKEPQKLEWNESEPEQWDVPEGLVAYSCDSCGGQIISDQTTVASHCPYCDNPIVMMGKLSGVLKPDYVIPFKLDKDAAIKAFGNHLKNKKLLPKLFKKDTHIQEIKGLYVPFWLFNCHTDADINYRATRISRWSSGDYSYKKTSHYLVSRAGVIDFERIPVDGSQKMPDDLMDSIEPFNYNEMIDFQTAYLAGYLADKYDVTADDSKERANQRIKQSTIDRFSQTVTGYATSTPTNSNIKISQSAIKYALLPVWILNTKYKNKDYTFSMNGQTGKFVGNLPMDKGAFARWFVGIFAAATAISAIVSLFL